VKLRRRGLAEVADAALAGIDADSERARAHQLVARRRPALAGLAPDIQARRLVGLLARKGYPLGLAYAVVREELAVDADWPGDEPPD
jgi:regulatory protein